MPHVDEGTIHAYLDGELASGDRSAVESHIAECSTCRARLAEERALVDRASQLLGLARPRERPAPPLQQLRQRRRVWRVRTPVAWAASIALALSIGYYLRGSDADTMAFRAAPLSPAAPRSVAPSEDRAAAPPAAHAPPPAAAEQAATRAPRGNGNRIDQPRDALTAPPAAGIVAIRPDTQLRDARVAAAARLAAPEPAALAEVDLALMRGRLLATEWPIIHRGPARMILGVEPVGVPGLPVRDIRRNPAGDGTVLVEQQLDSTTVIQLFQRPAATELHSYATPAPRRLDQAVPSVRERVYAPADRLARFVGALRVEIAGPLSQDSLNRLLEQVKPLP